MVGKAKSSRAALENPHGPLAHRQVIARDHGKGLGGLVAGRSNEAIQASGG
jgi:hypothetical protein